MSAADGSSVQDDRALVVGPLAMPGFLLVLIGVRRRRPLFVLVGAVLLGFAVKRVDRPRVRGRGEPERDASAPTWPEPPSAPEPPAAPETAAAAEPATPETPEPDQPEPA